MVLMWATASTALACSKAGGFKDAGLKRCQSKSLTRNTGGVVSRKSRRPVAGRRRRFHIVSEEVEGDQQGLRVDFAEIGHCGNRLLDQRAIRASSQGGRRSA